MRNRFLVGLSALTALFAAGCLFGGQDDASTTPVAPADTTAKVRKIVPGQYVGDYSGIDSNQYNLESEFLMDSAGLFRHLFIFDDEATYDHSGNWAQKDSAFLFSNILFSAVDGGLFDGSTVMEDDTNAVRDVTDSSFMRREWTPLRQKPYWIRYQKKNHPRITDGSYYLHKPHIIDSTAVDYLYRMDLTNKGFLFSITEDTLETFQVDAKFRQVGSFLLTEQHRIREKDSTNTFQEWFPVDGVILMRLKTISDTAFSMWTPPYSFESIGFDPYSKNAK